MLCWSAEADEKKCPKLTKFTKHFNTVSQWYAHSYIASYYYTGMQ